MIQHNMLPTQVASDINAGRPTRYTRLHTATGYENMLYNQAAKQRFYATDNPDLGLPWTAQQLCPIQDKRCSFQSEFWFRLT